MKKVVEMIICRVLISCLALIVISIPALSQLTETWYDVPEEVGGFWEYGSLMISEGDWLFVSAGGAGRVFIYHNDMGEWTHVDTKQSGLAGFGESMDVDLESGLLVVGAGENTNPAPQNDGGVYIYRLDGSGQWVFDELILAPEEPINCDLGQGVAVDQNRVAIGARRCDDKGAVFLYTDGIDGWELDTMIMAADTLEIFFGELLEMEDSVLIIGAPKYETFFTGSFYLFIEDEEGWSQRQFFFPPDTVGQLGANYRHVDYESGTFVFGGAGQDGPFGNENMGKVYIMELVEDSLAFTQSILPVDSMESCRFGASLDLRGDELLIGAIWNPDSQGIETGSSYHFTFNGQDWELNNRLWASNGVDGDLFGTGSAIAENGDMFVGAWGTDFNGTNSGALYYYADVFVGIHESHLHSIRVYPNPFTDYLTLEPELLLPYDYSIYDLSGRLLEERSTIMGKSVLDFSAMENGIFILTIVQDGNYSIRKLIHSD